MDGPDGRPSKIPPSRSINSFLVRPPSSLGGKEGRSSCSCERAPCLGWKCQSATVFRILPEAAQVSSLIKQGLHTKRDAGAEHSCTFSSVGRIRVEMNSSRNVVSMIHIHKLDGNRYMSIFGQTQTGFAREFITSFQPTGQGRGLHICHTTRLCPMFNSKYENGKK